MSITNNTLVNNRAGVVIVAADFANNADNNKVTGNTIIGVPAIGVGVAVSNFAPTAGSARKATISKNTIVAAPYTPAGTVPVGINISAFGPAQRILTATITGNMLLGLPVNGRIVNENNYAGLTIKGSDALP